MTDNADYSLEVLLPFARLALRETSNGDLYHFMDGLFFQLEKASIRGVRKKPQRYGGPYRYDYTADCPQELKNGATEVFLYLTYRGMVAPEVQSFPATFNFDRWHITPRGTDWAAGAEPVPEDTKGYITNLRSSVPTIDGVIVQYVQEGVSALARQAFFSAAVMLGAACEKEIYLLGQSLANALADPKAQKQLKEVLDRRSLFQLLNSIEKHLGLCKNPRDLFDGSQRHLLSMFESIRVQRNDAVHPNNANVSENSVRQAYAAFPSALKKAEQIHEWLDVNPSSI
jgi:hypothetical protein